MARRNPLLLILCAFGAQCKTVIISTPKNDMDGLWVSNDLYLKLEGHPATNDADEDLPNIRIKGDRFWMMDYSEAIDGSVEANDSQPFLHPLRFNGQSAGELGKLIGQQDAEEMMKPKEIACDPDAETLNAYFHVDYSKAAGNQSGHHDFRLIFRRLGSGPSGPNTVTKPEERALVGNWYGQIPPGITSPGGTEKDRAIKAVTVALENTQGLCLKPDHTYALVARELVTGTWTATADHLLLHAIKGSSKDPFAPVVPMAISPNKKSIELEDEKAKAIMVFAKE